MAPSASSTHRKARRRVIVVGCLVVVLSLAVLVYRSGAVVCTPLGAMTPILQLCQPASGETGWTAAINNNWGIIDNLFNSNGTLKTQFGGTGQTSILPTFTVFTSNGTFTAPAGVTKLYVQVYGAGGGGGGGGGAGGTWDGLSGPGGSGAHGAHGGYGADVFTVSPGASFTVTVGAGGTGGSGAGGGDGTNYPGSAASAGGTGGTSSFGALISATGGAGGGGGSGGTATGVPGVSVIPNAAEGTSGATINVRGGGQGYGTGGGGGSGGGGGGSGTAGANGLVVVRY